MPITEEDIRQHALKTERPIMGQSLTNDPDNQAPYERPPTDKTIKEATEYFFKECIQESTFYELMKVLASGVPVMDLVQIIRTEGCEEGMMNVHVLLLIAKSRGVY